MARGIKTGGRQKGTPNKATAAKAAEIAASGETPLDYMIRVMRDEAVDPDRRDRMATAAAPFIHPKLSSQDLTVTADEKRCATDWTTAELRAFLANAERPAVS